MAFLIQFRIVTVLFLVAAPLACSSRPLQEQQRMRHLLQAVEDPYTADIPMVDDEVTN